MSSDLDPTASGPSGDGDGRDRPQDLRQQLAEAVGPARWDWLQPHAKRDAVIVVTAEMDLVEVGVALAEDKAANVRRWIEEQAIYKPLPEQLSTWNEQAQASTFEALIVAPFVLIREPQTVP